MHSISNTPGSILWRWQKNLFAFLTMESHLTTSFYTFFFLPWAIIFPWYHALVCISSGLFTTNSHHILNPLLTLCIRLRVAHTIMVSTFPIFSCCFQNSLWLQCLKMALSPEKSWAFCFFGSVIYLLIFPWTSESSRCSYMTGISQLLIFNFLSMFYAFYFIDNLRYAHYHFV